MKTRKAGTIVKAAIKAENNRYYTNKSEIPHYWKRRFIIAPKPPAIVSHS